MAIGKTYSRNFKNNALAGWECPLGLLTSDRFPCSPSATSEQCTLNTFPYPKPGESAVWAQYEELDTNRAYGHAQTLCSGWTPSSGKWKGTGGKCARWGWDQPWCYIHSDYRGPGHEFAQASSIEGQFFLACEHVHPCNESTWPNRRDSLDCGPCMVLVDEFHGKHRSCDEYCRAIDRTCHGAWAASNNSCSVRSSLTCDSDWHSLYQNGSRAICECSVESTVSHGDLTDVSGSSRIRALYGYPFTDFTTIDSLPKIFFECDSCAGGANFSCRPGQAGRLCSSCAREPETWSSILGKCRKCNNDWRDYVIGIGGTGAVVLSWMGLNSLSAGEFDALDIALQFTQVH